jgi:hypothetical protein
LELLAEDTAAALVVLPVSVLVAAADALRVLHWRRSRNHHETYPYQHM